LFYSVIIENSEKKEDDDGRDKKEDSTQNKLKILFNLLILYILYD
jgi:hypothetical protein